MLWLLPGKRRVPRRTRGAPLLGSAPPKGVQSLGAHPDYQRTSR